MDVLKSQTETHKLMLANALDEMEKVACDSIAVKRNAEKGRNGKVVFFVVGSLIIITAGLLGAFVSPWLSAGAVAVCCGAFALIKEKMYPSVTETAEVLVNQVKLREGLQSILIKLERTLSEQSKNVIDDKDNLIKKLEIALFEKTQVIGSLQQTKGNDRRLIEEYKAELAECERTIEELTQRLSKYEMAEQKKSEEDNWLNISDKAVASDIDLSSADSFAQWLQFFATFALNSGNSDVAGIYGKLKSELKLQGIFVYDKLEYDGFGQVQVPDAAYFEDWRSSSEWTSVMKPIVYTKDKVLATGMIK